MAVSLRSVISVFAGLLLCGVDASDGELKDCISYRAKLTSMPDLTHRIVYQIRNNKDLQIVDVKNTNYQRSFYWCQLDIQESDNNIKRYRRFGFNDTHWWVEMGCGGWFVVTECAVDDRVIIRGIDGLLDSSNKAVTPPVISSPAKASKTSMNDRKESTIIDEMYKDWPKVGYHFPTSGKMWDTLDNVTYVDVAEQLGFYSHARQVRSTIFD